MLGIALAAHCQQMNQAYPGSAMTDTNGWLYISNRPPADHALFRVALRSVATGETAFVPPKHRGEDREKDSKRICAAMSATNQNATIEYVVVAPNGDIYRAVK